MERILMIPNKSEKNYYLILLEQALLNERIKIIFCRKLYFWFPVLKNVIKYKSKILHIHWIYNIAGFNIKNKVKSLIKLIVFLIDTLIAKYVFRIKIIWTIHNLYSHESFSHYLEKLTRKLFSKQVDRIIVHCNEARKQILNEYKPNPNKITVIPIGNYNNIYKNNISKEKARKNLKLDQNCFIFLCFGPIRPYKGVDYLISSFKSLNQDENIKLVIAGKPLNDQIKNKILKISTENKNIIFKPNFIPNDEIQDYMNAADIVVFPYRKILTSAGILLAMSFSKAIIAPKLGCLIDMLDDKGAFLYDPNQKRGLFLVLNQALKNRKILIKMGESNLTLSKKFDWGRIAKKTKDVYNLFEEFKIK